MACGGAVKRLKAGKQFGARVIYMAKVFNHGLDMTCGMQINGQWIFKLTVPSGAWAEYDFRGNPCPLFVEKGDIITVSPKRMRLHLYGEHV